MKLKINISRDSAMFGRGFQVRLGAQTPGDSSKWLIAKPVEFRELKEDEYHMEQLAAITLSTDDAQSFMDELWDVGIRPSEGSGSAGAMAAVQKHLEDMRKLVFERAQIKENGNYAILDESVRRAIDKRASETKL